MIETTQTVPVQTEIGRVWSHIRNIRNWAELMPGLQDYEIVDDDDSRWVLKVGVGALVRTVKVGVHVDEWDGPERVRFSFALQGDPVRGGGTYVAKRMSGSETQITLSLRVEGTGPMAPMWEAMGGPLLPKFALTFARQLAEAIEQANGVSACAENVTPPVFARLLIWVRKAWRNLRQTQASR